MSGSVEYGKYVVNLYYFIFNVNLDFFFGYVVDMFGIDLVVFGVVEMINSGLVVLNEIGFSDVKICWDEKWIGDKSGVSIYKVVVKFKLGDFWVCGGYI